MDRMSAWWQSAKEGSAMGELARKYPSRALLAQAIMKKELVRAEWEKGGALEFPGMRVDGVAWVESCDGLASFFMACRLAKGEVALPSLAADAVWHAWLRQDRVDLDFFCKRWLGRVVPHVEKASLRSPLELGIARCWALACSQQGEEPLSGKIPKLFDLDARLSMPGGWAYWHDRETGRIAHAPISKASRLPLTSKLVFHPALTSSALLAAGAIDGAQFALWAASSPGAKEKADASSGSSCAMGFSFGPASSDGGWSSDSGSGGDGGSDSGSSCGSGCGGGCGG